MKAKTTEGILAAKLLRPGDKVKPLRADSEGDGPKARAPWRLILSVDTGRNEKTMITFKPRSRRGSGYTMHIFDSDHLFWCRRVEGEEKP
jgi:hypothetical protein